MPEKASRQLIRDYKWATAPPSITAHLPREYGRRRAVVDLVTRVRGTSPSPNDNLYILTRVHIQSSQTTYGAQSIFYFYALAVTPDAAGGDEKSWPIKWDNLRREYNIESRLWDARNALQSTMKTK